jgi:hypothetical protein
MELESIRMLYVKSVCLLLSSTPGLALAGVAPLPTFRTLKCAIGPTTYRNAARNRDSGRRKEFDHMAWTMGPPGPDRDRAKIEAEQHNKLVRKICAHPEWSPDEVADRWRRECKAHSDRRTNGGAPWIIVDTLE